MIVKGETSSMGVNGTRGKRPVYAHAYTQYTRGWEKRGVPAYLRADQLRPKPLIVDARHIARWHEPLPLSIDRAFVLTFC